MVSFRASRGPLISKTSFLVGTFFCLFLQQIGSDEINNQTKMWRLIVFEVSKTMVKHVLKLTTVRGGKSTDSDDWPPSAWCTWCGRGDNRRWAAWPAAAAAAALAAATADAWASGECPMGGDPESALLTGKSNNERKIYDKNYWCDVWLGGIHKLHLQDEVGRWFKMSTFCQRLYHSKCTPRGLPT